jgi:hypothetical protein
MRIVLILVFLLCSSCLWAQRITISGTVTDQETGESLPFASVGIRGKGIGTITNQVGAFDFYVPHEYRNEILVISMLGYENFESPIWSLATEALLAIKMKKSTTILDEVVVEERFSGGDILRIAVGRIEENYPMTPFMLHGFYRDIKRVGGTSIALLEAAVKIYDKDYSEPRNRLRLRERVKLVEVRKSLGYDNRFTYYFDQSNFLEDLLLHNDVRYRQVESNELILSRMERLPDSYYNGQEIFVVEYNRDYFLKAFVNKSNFGILRLEYEIGPNIKINEKRKNLISHFISLKKTIDFREVDGRLFLNYMNMTSKVAWNDAQTNELKFETELVQQLLINEVVPNSNEQIGTTEKMRRYSLQYQDLPYNKAFWEKYNVIKDSPLDQKVLQDIEKAGPLLKQFEGNNY